MQGFVRGINSKMVIRFPRVNSAINKGDSDMHVRPCEEWGPSQLPDLEHGRVAPCSGVGDLLHIYPQTKQRLCPGSFLRGPRRDSPQGPCKFELGWRWHHLEEPYGPRSRIWESLGCPPSRWSHQPGAIPGLDAQKSLYVAIHAAFSVSTICGHLCFRAVGSTGSTFTLGGREGGNSEIFQLAFWFSF